MVPHLKVLLQQPDGKTTENDSITKAFTYTENEAPFCKHPEIEKKIASLRNIILLETTAHQSITIEDAIKMGEYTKEYLMAKSTNYHEAEKLYIDKLKNVHEINLLNRGLFYALGKTIVRDLMNAKPLETPQQIIVAGNDLTTEVNRVYSSNTPQIKVKRHHSTIKHANTANRSMFTKNIYCHPQ